MNAAGEGRPCLVTGNRPPGFRVIESFAGAAELDAIAHWIRGNFAWQKRHQGSLPPAEQYPHHGPIPVWANALGERMVAFGVFSHTPGHVLLRRYDCGVGVEPHIDREEYGPVVAGLTLTSSRVFQLTKGTSRFEVLLLPGDLYVMTGAARYRWRHSIPARAEDEFRGTIFPRTGGFSVTWRYAPAPARRRWLLGRFFHSKRALG